MRVNTGNRRDGSFRGKLEASITVEASLVMSALFLFIASLLTGIFEIHTRVVGNMVLQEALECCVYLEEEKSIGALAADMQQDYRGYFWCRGAEISLKEEGNRLSGTVQGRSKTSISVKTFDSENFLRLLRAAGV